MSFRFLMCLLTLVSSAEGYKFYQERIPNGDQVPHPCKANFFWRGLGHVNPQGGGKRNQFGIDFSQQGLKWTKALCQKDSDGDGFTNGHELGDPTCVWTPGAVPQKSDAITHPGICDPWGSTKCEAKNSWVDCTAGELQCDALDDPDVKNITIRFPKTDVPPTETTYMCMTFDLPLDENVDYHLVATKPFIDNENVMHHIVIEDCTQAKLMIKPEVCHMAESGCSQNIGLWTLGMAGECIYKDAGFKLGRHGAKRIGLQFHWTNPQKRTDYKDSSGVVLFYTAKLRKYNAGIFTFGQLFLDIPPRKKSIVHSSTCSGACTKHFMKGPIHITSAWNHMHYLGDKQLSQYITDGQTKVLADDPQFSYDTPVTYFFNEPFKIRPGDEFKTTCTFKSISRSTTSHFGIGTYDEMCFGVLTFFPLENLTSSRCLSWKGVNLCGVPTNNCDAKTFTDASNPETRALRKKVMDNCNYYGTCQEECPAVVEEVMKHPCMQGDHGEYMKYQFSSSNDIDTVRFVSALKSCDSKTTSTGGGNCPMLQLSMAVASLVASLLTKAMN